MMRYTLFPSVKNSIGKSASRPWPEFVKDHLSDHQVINNKDAGLMYSGAVYSMDPPKRGDANVDSMSMMVVDYDNSQGIGLDSKCSGLPTLPQDVEPELAGNAYAFHSTHSQSKDWPRWRLVIPFDRLVSRTEWPIVFNYVYERILGSDTNIDTTCKDLSRAYWQPACTKDTLDVAFTGYAEGELLNIDEIMDQMQTTISPEFMAAMADNVVNLVTPQVPKPLDEPRVPEGRNDYLKQIVAAMLERAEPLEEIICQVYQADVDKHGANALFTDAAEGMKGSPGINCMGFVTNVIRSIDSMRTRAAIEPQIPTMRPVNAVLDNKDLLNIEPPAKFEIVQASSLYGHEPKPMEWVMEDWMPRGQTTLIYGDGGVGKTQLIQQLMSCVATGRPFMGVQCAEGPAMGFFCEDDIHQLHRRQASINTLYGMDFRGLDNLYLSSRPAQDNVLMEFDSKNVNGVKTAIWHQLREKVGDIKPAMLTIDTAADTFGGNEIDRQQVRRYIQGCLTSLSLEFEMAVALLCHPSASGLANGTGAGGSTAWNNTGRCRWYIFPNPEKGCITMKIMKNNYGKKDLEIDFKHNGDGFYAYGKAEIDSFVDQLTFDLDKKWIIEQIAYCKDRNINLSMQNRANYYPKQLLKLAKQDKYNISFSTIESIVYNMDKKGQIEHLERGNRHSNGASFIYKGI